ncbi:MAG: glycosyltransferase [Planctomycetes bacterium]|nr:glycosyltransferase [Planctomycetota bacterium]
MAVVQPKRLYWDLTHMGRAFPDGIGRFVCAMAAAEFALPSVYLLHPRLIDGGLHRVLSNLPGTCLIARKRPGGHLFWKRSWDQLLPEPGIVFAPANFHEPTLMPTIVVVHDTIPYDDPAYHRFQHLSRSRYGGLLQRADVVLAASDYTASRIAALFPSIAAVRRIDQALFPEPAVSKPTSAPADPYYLFVGGAEPRKRLEDAVALASSLDDAALVVIGGDFGRRRVADLVRSWSGKRPLIQVPGCDDAQLAWYYRHCRALLYPTRMEGFGLPALECLRSGRPVVARPLSSLPEVLGDFAIWDDFSVRADPGPLRQRIAGWTATDDLRAHLSRFSWQQSRDRMALIVREVVDRCGRG